MANEIYNSEYSPVKSYLDIEIELLSDDFPEPDKAAMPVNLITFCNSRNDCYVLSTMKDPESGSFLSKNDELEITDDIHKYFSYNVPID